MAARIGAKGIVAQSMDGVAGIVAADGRVAEAATLWAAAESIRREARYHLLLADRRRSYREIAAARATIDEEAWWQAWAAGERLGADEAIARAQAVTGPTEASPRAAGNVGVPG